MNHRFYPEIIPSLAHPGAQTFRTFRDVGNPLTGIELVGKSCEFQWEGFPLDLEET